MTYALIAILVMQVIDGYSTYRILRNGGVEYNPAQKWLIGKLGVVSAMVLSKSAVSCVAISLYINQSEVIYFGAVLYAVVVINNLYQWKKQ